MLIIGTCIGLYYSQLLWHWKPHKNQPRGVGSSGDYKGKRRRNNINSKRKRQVDTGKSKSVVGVVPAAQPAPFQTTSAPLLDEGGRHGSEHCHAIRQEWTTKCVTDGQDECDEGNRCSDRDNDATALPEQSSVKSLPSPTAQQMLPVPDKASSTTIFSPASH